MFDFILCSTFDYLESLIISFIKNETIIKVQTVYFILYSAVLITVIAVCKIKRPNIPSDFLEQIPKSIYIVIFFADYSAYYNVMVSKDTSYDAEFSNILKLLSAALIVGCFSYIIYRFTRLSYKQKESEIQLEAELKHYEEMVRKNRDIRTFRHDYKNNLYSIKTLIKSGRLEETERYIEELESDLKLTENKFNTGNYFADAIISGKAVEALKKNITIEFKGMIPQDKIKNNDLCTLLSNALDNAVRASAEVSPCTIIVIADTKPNGFVLEIINPVKENIAIKNNTIKTTKSDKINHGIGLSNIKKTAMKYDGYVDLTCENNLFKIEIGLIISS